LKYKDKTSLIALIFNLLFSALTLTRIGYLGILIEFIVFLAFYWSKKRKDVLRRIIIYCFSVPIIGLVLLVSADYLINKLVTQRGDTQSSRFIQYERVFDYAMPNNWFTGIGTGQYQAYLKNNFFISDINIHSQYINTLAENGLIIFVLYVIFNFWLLIKIWRKQNDKLIRIFSLAFFIANLICSNFNPNQYYFVNNVLYYFVMFSLLFGQVSKEKESRNHNEISLHNFSS
ncbi:O-antigen ligase family protein, partial [Terribacillus saccharophilus]